MYLAVMVNKICFNMNLRDAGFEDWKMDDTGSRLSPKAGFGMTSVSPLYSIIRELLRLLFKNSNMTQLILENSQ